MENIVHPTVKEIEILNLICSRFFNLYDEFISDSFLAAFGRNSVYEDKELF